MKYKYKLIRYVMNFLLYPEFLQHFNSFYLCRELSFKLNVTNPTERNHYEVFH